MHTPFAVVLFLKKGYIFPEIRNTLLRAHPQNMHTRMTLDDMIPEIGTEAT